MTYLQFHLVFLLPPLLLLLVRAAVTGALTRPRAGLTLAVLPLIALAYTTPWDNYLVATGVWSYGADRVLGTIGWVPVEEYLFFLLQPILLVLWLLTGGRALLGSRQVHHEAVGRAGSAGPVRSGAAADVRARRSADFVAVAFLLLAAGGVMLLATNRGVYLGLILVWAAPVLAAQWWLTGDVASAAPRAWLRAWLPPTAYLWLADWTAIRLGIWRINESATAGLSLAGLPLEEAVFFLVTNLLSLHGALLLVEPWRLRVARPALS